MGPCYPLSKARKSGPITLACLCLHLHVRKRALILFPRLLSALELSRRKSTLKQEFGTTYTLCHSFLLLGRGGQDTSECTFLKVPGVFLLLQCIHVKLVPRSMGGNLRPCRLQKPRTLNSPSGAPLLLWRWQDRGVTQRERQQGMGWEVKLCLKGPLPPLSLFLTPSYSARNS